jgi:hypothetical protein
MPHEELDSMPGLATTCCRNSFKSALKHAKDIRKPFAVAYQASRPGIRVIRDESAKTIKFETAATD